MIPKSAWGASARGTWGERAVGPAPRGVLLALWDHAHGWREGDGDAFVFPSIDTLACKLGVSARAIYRGLAELERHGWVRRQAEKRRIGDRWEERLGWLLVVDPRMPPRELADEASQLDLFAAGEPPASGSEIEQPRAREVAATDEVVTADLTRSSPTTDEVVTDSFYGTDIEPSLNSRAREPVRADHDDVAARIWSLYERERVRELGTVPGQPAARGGAPPRALVELAAELDERTLERYAVGSIACVVGAARAGRHEQAAALAQQRCDGREWSRVRVDAVLRRLDGVEAMRQLGPPAVDRLPARSLPPADPVVDGRRVDRWEREVWDAEGDEGVRRLRAAQSEHRAAGVATIEDWLRRRRAEGTCDG